MAEESASIAVKPAAAANEEGNMKKTFKEWFIAWDNTLMEVCRKAPLSSNLSLIMIFFLFFFPFIVLVIMELKTVPLEFEMDCSSGEIGLHFKERFVFNETNPKKPLISSNPQELSIDGIKNINCKIKGKIEMPLMEVKKTYGRRNI